MPTSFVITTPSPTLALDAQRSGELPVTVTNVTGRELRVRLRLVPTPPMDPAWLDGGGEQLIALGGTAQFPARLRLPMDAPPQAYTFRVDAAAEDNPDEVFAQGPTISATAAPAPAPPRRFPLIPVLAAVVAVLLVAGGLLWLFRPRPAVPPPPPAPRPVVDLLALAPAAHWSSGVADPLPYPGSEIDDRGFVLMRTAAQMEDRLVAQALETHPQWVPGGSISGDFALPGPIQAGDRFLVELSFYAGGRGEVDYVVSAVSPDGAVRELGRKHHRGADLHTDAWQVDLTRAAGALTLRLTVLAGPSSGQDWACWLAPRIEPAAR